MFQKRFVPLPRHLNLTHNLLCVRADIQHIKSNKPTKTLMQAISINNALYAQAKAYATANNISVEQWVATLIARFAPSHVKSTSDEEPLNEELHLTSEDFVLSPEMLEPIKNIKPLPKNFNFDKARIDYLMQKYG